MKTFTLIFSLFLSIVSIANTENPLTVEQEGLTLEVLDFSEGDKLKLFEVETGDHILSKSYARIDLSQLPVGSYQLENNAGNSIIIERLEENLKIEGAIVVAKEGLLVQNNNEGEVISETINAEELTDVNEEIADLYTNENRNVLAIHREGDIITVLDFVDGDKLKLFEAEDETHILSKTSNVIDLGLLAAGAYLLENNNGGSVIIVKGENTEVPSEESLATM